MRIYLIRKLRGLRASWQRAREEQRKEEINARISVREKKGTLFLCCNGTAFAEIDGKTTAQQTRAEIERARLAAQKFEGK